MLTAISRYGARVLPNTQQLVQEIDGRGELLEGPHIAQFEAAFARRFGARHAVSASFGRVAFYYVLEALDARRGSEIVFPALTFWVMPEMARVAGFTPVFADVDPATFTLRPDALERVITPRTVAVVPTHLWGLPCDMDAIVEIARRHGLLVIEDCAHALGATHRGRSVGTIGDAGIFSLQTLKPLNTYGGGIAVMEDGALAARVRARAEAEPIPTEASVRKKLWHGRVQRISIRPRVFTWTLFPVLWTCAMFNTNPDVYLWESIGPLDQFPPVYRERYSNVQAALGLEALEHFDRWTEATRRNAMRMTMALAGIPGIQLPTVPEGRTHAFYQYCAYVPSRDEVVRFCLRHGIDLETLHVDMCPSLPLFKPFSTPAPGAERAQQAVQIPVYESLASGDVDRIATVVRQSASSRRDRFRAAAAL
jgi:perosamine synthetase